jgi:hypothetical protein
MRLSLLLLAAGLSVHAFAQDDQGDEPGAPPSSASGVGARTTYQEATPNMGPDSAEEVVSPLPPLQAPRGSASVKRLLAAPGPQAAAAAVAGGGAGGVTCGLPGPGAAGVTHCEITAKSPYQFEVSDDLPSMRLHAGAHGGMIFGPSNGYSVGFYGDSMPRMAMVGGSMPAFPNQGCSLAVWISATPGGAPIQGSTWKEAVARNCAAGASGMYGDADLSFSTGMKEYVCRVPAGVRVYLNVVPNMPPFVPNAAPWWGDYPDANGKFGWRQVLCEENVGSPLGVAGPDAAAADPGAGRGPGPAAGGGAAPSPAAPACNVCAYADQSTHFCVLCGGDPAPCDICPPGTPGPAVREAHDD